MSLQFSGKFAYNEFVLKLIPINVRHYLGLVEATAEEVVDAWHIVNIQFGKRICYVEK
jgi:hypothetical protein